MGWLARHTWPVAAALLFAALAGPFVTRRDSEWDAVYVEAARHLLAGEDVYNPHDSYSYPPFMAFAALPFTALPPRPERIAWFLLNVAAILALVVAAWRLSGGARVPTATRADRREGWIFALGLAAGGYYLFDALAHQQTDAVIACMLLVGALGVARGRETGGAALLGLAAAAKCTALLWAPFLLWKQRPKAAAVLVAVALGANLLPNLVSAPAEGGTWLGRWGRQFLAPLTRPDACPGAWASDILYNQSLAGAANRWSRTELAHSGPDLISADRVSPPSVGPVKATLYGTELLLLVGVAGLTRGRSVPPRPTPAPVTACEASLVCVLMLLLSPMSSKPHFIPLLLPGFWLARRAIAGRSWAAAVALAPAVVLGFASNKDLVGGTGYTALLWSGSVTLSALALGLGCAAEALRQTHGRPIPDFPQNQPECIHFVVTRLSDVVSHRAGLGANDGTTSVILK
jgi:hypothetical protein